MTGLNAPLLLCALLLALPLIANAAPMQAGRARIERQFTDWLNGPLWRKASAQGISRPIFDAALANVRLNWTLPDLDPAIMGGAGEPPRQSEFRAPGLYFRPSEIASTVRQGRIELGRWRDVLRQIEQRSGVPAAIIIAIWGKETAFGRAALPYNAIEVLASQAFMGRRKPLFEAELLAALAILEAGHVAPSAMKSAWAGALGHPQFMPSAFRKYAVDFDGDGRKDIWNSVPDALASIGHFLARNGWSAKRGWGIEASVPATVSCTLEGPDQGLGKARWRQMGVADAQGQPLPAGDEDGERFLMMPAGRLGPAFLVTANFYVLKTYNTSDVYALFIGHVADRMREDRRDDGGFRAAFAPLGSLGRDKVLAAQLRLQRHGHDVGAADGLIGYKTRIAVGKWQLNRGRAVTCFPAAAELDAIE